MKIKKISQSAGFIANVVNDLNSDSTIDALSAAAGKELNDKIQNAGGALIIYEKDGEEINLPKLIACFEDDGIDEDTGDQKKRLKTSLVYIDENGAAWYSKKGNYAQDGNKYTISIESSNFMYETHGVLEITPDSAEGKIFIDCPNGSRQKLFLNNTLTSTNTTDEALSANQGRILNEKIEALANNAGGSEGIIDVTELPAITEENKNDIVRYNGELYAVAKTYQEFKIDEDEQKTITLTEEGRIIFNHLPAFLGESDLPASWSRQFSKIFDITNNTTNETINMILYYPYGNSDRLFLVGCEDTNNIEDTLLNPEPLAGYYTGRNTECIRGALMFEHSASDICSITLEPGTYRLRAGVDLNWEFSQSFRIVSYKNDWTKLSEIETLSGEFVYDEYETCYLEHGGIVTPLKFKKGSTWDQIMADGYDNASQNRYGLFTTFEDGLYIVDDINLSDAIAAVRWKITNLGLPMISEFDSPYRTLVQPGAHYQLERIYVINGDYINSLGGGYEIYDDNLNSEVFYKLRENKDIVYTSEHGEQKISYIATSDKGGASLPGNWVDKKLYYFMEDSYGMDYILLTWDGSRYNNRLSHGTAAGGSN